MGSFFKLRSQFFPPKPTFTEKDVPSQRGKVFIVTGGNSGIGFELCKMLYGTGATIYMAARSKVSSQSLQPFAMAYLTPSRSEPQKPSKALLMHPQPQKLLGRSHSSPWTSMISLQSNLRRLLSPKPRINSISSGTTPVWARTASSLARALHRALKLWLAYTALQRYSSRNFFFPNSVLPSQLLKTPPALFA